MLRTPAFWYIVIILIVAMLSTLLISNFSSREYGYRVYDVAGSTCMEGPLKPICSYTLINTSDKSYMYWAQAERIRHITANVYSLCLREDGVVRCSGRYVTHKPPGVNFDLK